MLWNNKSGTKINCLYSSNNWNESVWPHSAYVEMQPDIKYKKIIRWRRAHKREGKESRINFKLSCRESDACVSLADVERRWNGRGRIEYPLAAISLKGEGERSEKISTSGNHLSRAGKRSGRKLSGLWGRWKDKNHVSHTPALLRYNDCYTHHSTPLSLLPF